MKKAVKLDSAFLHKKNRHYVYMLQCI